jgi:type II secretory pathway component GspD/PulD (secretin)
MNRRSSLALAFAALAAGAPVAFAEGATPPAAGGAAAAATGGAAAPGAPVEAGGAPAAGEQVYINLIAQERDLRQVVREIERKAGVNIYVEPGIEEVVTVQLVNLPWRQVLEIVARDAGVEIEERSPRLFILSQPPRVSMEFADADIRIVLDLLARQAGKNIVIGNEVKGTVTLNLRNVHWWRALETIVKTAGFVAVREQDDMIRVVLPSSLQAQLTTKVYPLNYLRPPDEYKAIITERENTGGGGQAGSAALFVANAQPPKGVSDFTLLKALQQMVGRNERVDYNVESNSFIVNATDATHADIAALLRKIDVEPQQVFVDVKFITTRNTNFWREGLKLGDPVRDPSNAGVKVGLLTNQAPFASQFPFSFGEGTSVFQKAFSVPAVLDFSQMTMLMQFVDIDNNTKVTQAPTLLTLNDREAVIFVGEKVPFAQQRATQDQNGNVTVTLQESPQSPVSIGFTLFITPHIVRDTDQIILTVIPRVTRLTGNEANGLERFEFADPRDPTISTFIDLPRVADQTVVTKLLVHDRTTAVIGGLMQESVTEVEERIPILSKIPLIGSLFSFESKDYAQENLIIFITPRIVRSAADSTAVFQRQYQIHQENDFFYLKYLKEKEGEGRHMPRGAKKTEQPAPAVEPLGATASEPGGAAPPAARPSEAAPAPAPEGTAPAAPEGTVPAPSGGTTPVPSGTGTAPTPPAPPPETPATPATPGGTPSTPPPSGPETPSPETAPSPSTSPAPGGAPPGAGMQPTTPGGRQAYTPSHEQENADQRRRAGRSADRGARRELA